MKGISALAQMSERERRVLTAGAACILVMILVGRVVPAVRRWDARAELRDALLTRELAEGRSIVGNEKAATGTLRSRTGALVAVESGLIHAEGKAAGEAALAALVSTTAASAGIKVDALALDAAGDRTNGVDIVSVSGGATGDIAGVSTFLAALERAPSRIAMRAISIGDADPAAPDSRAELLRLEFTVEAEMISASRRSR